MKILKYYYKILFISGICIFINMELKSYILLCFFITPNKSTRTSLYIIKIIVVTVQFYTGIFVSIQF